jgi:nuclear transport factor 2 (NTF2) superfamily protein
VADQPATDRSFVPPFDESAACHKLQAVEDTWNTRDPARVVGAYTADSVRRNRTEFLHGPDEIVAFTRKWQHEQDHAVRKSLWVFSGGRIAVRCQYEWHDEAGSRWRSYGNENWEFEAHGYINRREASINDIAITAAERRLVGPRRPAEHDHALPIQ